MTNLIKAEFMKLKKHKTFTVLIALTALQGILAPLLTERATGAETFMKMYQGQEYITLMLFFSALAGTFIAYDFEQGVFKHPIAFGHKKSHVVLSKFLMYMAGCCVLSFIVPVISVGINTYLYGLGVQNVQQFLPQMLITSLLMTLVYMGIASLAAALAFVSRNAIVTITTFAGLDLVRRLATIAASRNDDIAKWYSKTIFFQSNSILYEGLNTGVITQVITVSLLTIIAAFLISVTCVKQFDIK